MSDDRCPYCQAPYKGDLDENGKPFCDCEGSRIAELQAEIERLRKKVERASVLLGLERAARLTVEERLKSLRSQYDIWRELNPDNDDNEEDKGISMDTLLQSAKTDDKLMIDAWNGDVTMLDALLDEIRDELMRGLGVEETPRDNFTPDEQGKIDDTLKLLGLEK